MACSCRAPFHARAIRATTLHMSRWTDPSVARLFAWGTLLLAGLLAYGCSRGQLDAAAEGGGAEAEGTEPAVSSGPSSSPGDQLPSCPVQLQVTGHSGPLAGLSIDLRAMKQVDERVWKAIASTTVLTAADGSVGTQLPCGTALSLSSSGWMWANQRDKVLVHESMQPVQVELLPELTVRLFVHGGKGPKVKDARFHAPGDELGQPVPHEGLIIPGVRMTEVAGEIRSANLPSRLWWPQRSEELEQVRPGMFDAVVVLGDIQQIWMQLNPALARALEGALCVVDGQRRERCTYYQGLWRCPCPPGSSLGLYGPRWDVGIVRKLDGPDLLLDTLPEAESLCLAFPGVSAAGVSLNAQPAGVSGGLLLGGMPRPLTAGSEVCLKLAHGEAVDLQLAGSAGGPWWVTPDGLGRLELPPP